MYRNEKHFYWSWSWAEERAAKLRQKAAWLDSLRKANR